MSREFNGSDGIHITCNPGSLSSNDGGPITIACLWKPFDLSAQGLIHALNGSFASVWAINPYSDGLVYYGTNTGFTSSNPTVYQPTGLPWRIDVFTKATGSATVRYHEYRFDTTTWAHADKGSVSDASNGPVTLILLGALDGDETLNGRIGAIGVWNSVLSDVNIETLENALQNWVDLSPAALWKFNTDDVASGAVDIIGSADETSHSGTSFSSDEPSPFDYTLTGGGPAKGQLFMPFFQ